MVEHAVLRGRRGVWLVQGRTHPDFRRAFMIWDIFVQDLPAGFSSVADIPDEVIFVAYRSPATSALGQGTKSLRDSPLRGGALLIAMQLGRASIAERAEPSITGVAAKSSSLLRPSSMSYDVSATRRDR